MQKQAKKPCNFKYYHIDACPSTKVPSQQGKIWSDKSRF